MHPFERWYIFTREMARQFNNDFGRYAISLAEEINFRVKVYNRVSRGGFMFHRPIYMSIIWRPTEYERG